MNTVTFDYKKSAQVEPELLTNILNTLAPEHERMVQAVKRGGYDSEYAALNLPSDTALLHEVKALSAAHQALKPTIMVVIGIGGSNLGAQAVRQALQGMLYNQVHPSLRVYWADTVDTDYIRSILECVEQELKQYNTCLLVVISKSGTTTETAANFAIFLELLKKYNHDTYHKHVVAITDNGSALWQVAQQEKFACLAIPAHVGGRYSVLSAAGLFPLAMLGIDIEQLVLGAAACVQQCLQQNSDTSAAVSAAILFYHLQHAVTIHDTFLFAHGLVGIGNWYRQLVGESLGKDGKGITPTVSIGSIDLHSVGQLYLGGPHDKVTTFVTLVHTGSAITIPTLSSRAPLVAHIQGKTLAAVMDAITSGVQTAYMREKRPFMTSVFSACTAYTIGYFMQMKMIEVIYTGFLLGVNPFDQPHVELYKKETREILAHE